MNPGDCLPAALRGPGTRITPLAPRDSGSQVFLVEAGESALSLGDFYGKLRESALQLGTPDGQWAFGLALLKESIGL